MGILVLFLLPWKILSNTTSALLAVASFFLSMWLCNWYAGPCVFFFVMYAVNSNVLQAIGTGKKNITE